MMANAYLYLEIDTRTRAIKQARILSDQRPSIIGNTKAWALLLTGYGADYAQARKSILKSINEPGNYWNWVRPILDRVG